MTMISRWEAGSCSSIARTPSACSRWTAISSGPRGLLGPVGQIVGEHRGSGRGALSVRDLVVGDTEDERLEGPPLVSISR